MYTYIEIDVGNHSRIGLFNALPDLFQILIEKKVICKRRLEGQQLLSEGSYRHIGRVAGRECSGQCELSDGSPLVA